MSERLRELLDAAVAEVRPRRSDPVSDIVRREGGRRRRVAVAASVVSVLLVVCGVVLGRVLVGAVGEPETTAGSGRPAASSSNPQSGSPTVDGPARPIAPIPATPRVMAGRVESGGLTLPIPAGWQVRGLPATQGCIPARTITLGWGPTHDGRCTLDRIISVWGVAGGLSVPGLPAPATSQFVLPGGQPAWLGMGPHGSPDPFGSRPGLRTVQLYVPWSSTFLELNLGYEDLTTVLATVRTEAIAPSRLVLHTDAVGGYYVPASNGPTANAMYSNDRAAAEQVLKRLRELTEVVPAGRECGTADQAAVTVHLFPSDGATTGNDTVVITASEDCAQATSANGGRVRVPPGLVDELRPFFPIRAEDVDGITGEPK